MKLIILSEEHYIVVDDSEIQIGDWYIDDVKSIRQSITSNQDYWSTRKEYKKITHSTQPIEEFNWMGNSEKGYDTIKPIPLSEVKALIGVVDVEKKAERDRLDTGWEDSANLPYTSGFVRGYNQALEDNKDRKWTDEDVIRIVEKSRITGLTAEYLLLTLQPKTEWNVEIVDGKLKLKQ